MYKLLRDTTVVRRLEDGAFIPDDPDSADRQAFIRWRDGWTETLEDGTEVAHLAHEPEPADPPIPPTQDELQEAEAVGFGPLRTLAGMTQAQIDAHIDTTFPAWTAPQRQVMKILARATAVLLRREFGGRL